MPETKTKHVVVDGSNIATEGRSLPSLAQLNEAVLAFMEEHPDALVTVVVDATFGHRIDSSENDEFEAGISNNELVAPPAGAVGRGDAFVLGIADKAKALILSNDSFQEFHGEYPWLFDEGRLIGGKPVPHVGWVFVDRVPVRGPISRKATRGKATAKSTRGGRSRRKSTTSRKKTAAATASIDATGPAPVPTAPPPGRAMRAAAAEPVAAGGDAVEETTSGKRGSKQRGSNRNADPVNDVVPFLEFVEHHPVGSSVTGTVESYSSHGAYVTVDGVEVRAYIPLRLMADPPPRSARAALAIGTEVEMFVVSFTPDRRSIDCALPAVADEAIAAARAEAAAADVDDVKDEEAQPTPQAEAPRKRGSRKKAAAKRSSSKETETAEHVAPVADVDADDGDPATAPSADSKKPARTKATAKKSAAKKATAKKATAKKAATKKTAAKPASAKKTTAKTAAAKKATAKKATAKKVTAKKVVAKKATAKKTPAKKVVAKKAAVKKTASKKTAGKKASAKTAAAKKSTAKKTGAD